MRNILTLFCLLLFVSVMAIGCGTNGADENTTNGNQSEEVANNAENETENNSNTTNEDCPDPDDFGVRKEMLDDFYFPECTTQYGYSKGGLSVIKGIYQVEGGDLEEIYEGYKEYFGEKLNSEELDLENGTASLTAYILEDESHRTKVYIENMEDDVVEMTVFGNDDY